MDLSNIVSAAIYPAIGIARVGNSTAPDDYFVGPTVPGEFPSDPSTFRDSSGKIKRQAARFSIYGLDKNGEVVAELTGLPDVNIDWQVTVANKKASWYDFDIALDTKSALGIYNSEGAKSSPPILPMLSQRRNRSVPVEKRESLMITPPQQTITGTNQDGSNSQFVGQITDIDVYLGELRTDEQGRLLFLGGRGHSASFNDKPLTTFANNQGWFDDTSDGPVDATVTLPGGKSLDVTGAWVLTAPPNYAVGVQASTTGFDLIRDVAAQNLPKFAPETPEFYRDIYPMLKNQSLNQWVNAGILRDYGWGSAYDFENPEVIAKLADSSNATRMFRQTIFEACRNPDFANIETQAWPPLYGDAVAMNANATDPQTWYAVTKLQYSHLKQWALGNFTVSPPAYSCQSAAEQANGLTQAALEETLGGPFHPGCEFTWPMRHRQMYQADLPFRIKRRDNQQEDFGIAISPEVALAPGGPLDGSSPGDITKWMAVPWQTDTSSCLSAYSPYSGEYLPTFWPARVPNDVLTEADFDIINNQSADEDSQVAAFSPSSRKKWLRGFIYNDEGQIIGGSSIDDRNAGIKKFTAHWDKAGIVVKQPLSYQSELFPEEVWVETGRQEIPEDKNQKYSRRPAWTQVNPRKLR